MKTIDTLTQKFIEDKEVKEIYKKIFKLRKQLEIKITQWPYFAWTCDEMRNFLEKQILKQPKFQKLSPLIKGLSRSEIRYQLDLITPVSIGHYRADKWQDTSLAIEEIHKNKLNNNEYWVEYHPLWQNYEERLIKRTNNMEILKNNPLTEAEVLDFQKRLIYAKAGGINNIKNMRIIKIPFPFNDGVNNDQNFLAVEVKSINDLDSCLYDQYDAVCIFSDNEKYARPLKNIAFLKTPYELEETFKYDLYDYHQAEETQLQNNTLIFLISNKDEELVAVNDFIDNWKKDNFSLEAKALRNFVNNQIKEAKVHEINNIFQTEALKIMVLQDDLNSLIKKLDDRITSLQIYEEGYTDIRIQNERNRLLLYNIYGLMENKISSKLETFLKTPLEVFYSRDISSKYSKIIKPDPYITDIVQNEEAKQLIEMLKQIEISEIEIAANPYWFLKNVILDGAETKVDLDTINKYLSKALNYRPFAKDSKIKPALTSQEALKKPKVTEKIAYDPQNMPSTSKQLTPMEKELLDKKETKKAISKSQKLEIELKIMTEKREKLVKKELELAKELETAALAKKEATKRIKRREQATKMKEEQQQQQFKKLKQQEDEQLISNQEAESSKRKSKKQRLL